MHALILFDQVENVLNFFWNRSGFETEFHNQGSFFHWKISEAEAMLVGCPECTVRRGSHVSLPRLPNRACSITPLTHNHPSLPPSLPVALFHSSIDSFLSVQKKHYTVRALANQCSMCSPSEWFLNIVHQIEPDLTRHLVRNVYCWFVGGENAPINNSA